MVFFDSKGRKVASVRPDVEISQVSFSRDTTALLICGPKDRKKPNHINVLSLYALNGVRKWQVNTGALDQVGQSAIGSAFVYVTTRVTKTPLH